MSIKFRINGNKNITHDKIKARIGLTDKLNHNVFYIEGGAFLTPNENIDDFGEIMYDIEKSCKRSLKNKLMSDSILDNNFIMNFDVCTDRMKKDKKSYFSFQYHFKQKDGKNNSVLDLKDRYGSFFTGLLDDICMNLEEFKIGISKEKKVEVC